MKRIFFILILVSIVFANCTIKNKNDNYSNWKKIDDSIFGYSVLVPQKLEYQYYDYCYTVPIITDSSDNIIWEVFRIPKKMYDYDSQIKGNSHIVDSASVLINEKNCKLYKLKYSKKESFEPSSLVTYETKDFIFEISTRIENDSLFENFYNSFMPDTQLLTKQFKEFISDIIPDTLKRIKSISFKNKLKKGIENHINFNIVDKYDTTSDIIQVQWHGCNYYWRNGIGHSIVPVSDTINLKIYLVNLYFHCWKLQVDTTIKL